MNLWDLLIPAPSESIRLFLEPVMRLGGISPRITELLLTHEGKAAGHGVLDSRRSKAALEAEESKEQLIYATGLSANVSAGTLRFGGKRS